MTLNRRLLPLWILLLGSLWTSPLPAQETETEKYLAEVLSITSKYPDRAIPNHYAGGQEKRDAVRLFAIAEALTRLAPEKYPRNHSPRERLSILVKEQSPALSRLFVSSSGDAHFALLVEEWRGQMSAAGKANREAIERGRLDAIRTMEKYQSTGGPRFTRGLTELEDATRLENLGHLLHRLNPVRFEDTHDVLKNVQKLVETARPDLSKALEGALQVQKREAEEQKKWLEKSDDWQPTREAQVKFLKKEQQLQKLRQKALSIMNRYEATGGPREYAIKGETAPESDEIKAYQALRRISAGLYAVDPAQFERSSDRRNLARLLKVVPGEGPSLEALFLLRRASPGFPAAVAEWKKAKKEPPTPIAAEIDSIESLRNEALKILDSYPLLGRPRRDSPIAKEVSDATRLEVLGRGVIRNHPELYANLNPRQALARVMEEADPLAADILRLDVDSAEFKDAVENRNRVAPLMPEAEHKILAYQKEVIAIFDTYSDTGGPRAAPTLENEADRAREKKAYVRLTEISNRLGGLDATRFLPRAQRENLARLVENLPGGGAELAEVIRTRRGLSEIRKKVSEWRSARAKAQDSLPAAPDMEPSRAMPERLRSFLDQYPSVKSILNDSVKIMHEFRETGGPIEWESPQTLEQKRERSAARILQLLNYRLREIDPKLFSLPGKVGNLAKAIENVPGQGTELADLLRTDRVDEPELYEQKRQRWLAVFESDSFIDCISNGGQKGGKK